MQGGVLCLAGANGIGKSTFLAAINFALTGCVPTPSRSYKSTSEYYQSALQFSARFFEGRVEETDRQHAAVSLSLEVGDITFDLSRGLFEPEALRVLTVAGKSKKDSIDGSALSGTHRQSEYAERLSSAVGLQSFDQFVFLQHFVLTFDEGRHLLFWDEKALESALFLAFDNDPAQQVVADGYRREMERADSRARNAKFHALRVATRINAIQSSIGSKPSPDSAALEVRYENLTDAQDQALTFVAELEAQSRDSDSELAGASAALFTLRSDYSKAFGRQMGKRRNAVDHPLLNEALEELRCGVCGQVGKSVKQAIEDELQKHRCPLCESKLEAANTNQSDLDALKELDKRISAARKNSESAALKRDRVRSELTAAQSKANAAMTALRDFETKHAEIAKRVKGRASASPGAQEELDRLEAEQKTLLQESKAAYGERDTWKKKLTTLQRKLEGQYRAAEKEFVPLFRDLAERFIGVDLDVLVESTSTGGISLVLQMRATKRRLQYQLSESQRFFLDIALRMALAQFVSDKSHRAALVIDTPEGSLDIAYENRAGKCSQSLPREDTMS